MIHFQYYITKQGINYDCCQTENQYFRRKKKLEKQGFKVERIEKNTDNNNAILHEGKRSDG